VGSSEASRAEALDALLADKRRHEGYLQRLEERRESTPAHLYARLHELAEDATIFTSSDATRIAIGFGPASYVIIISIIRRDKSSVDDFDMERGIVSVRVGFVLRSTEIQPLVPSICC